MNSENRMELYEGANLGGNIDGKASQLELPENIGNAGQANY